MVTEKRQLTKAEYKKLDDELQHLIDVERPQYKKELDEARSEGDLSENADYDAARNKQAQVEGRIVQLQAILSNAEIINEKNKGTKKVSVGSTVKFKKLDSGQEREFTIADSSVSNPMQGTISPNCALGTALMGKMVGDVVDVKAVEPYKIEILEIKIRN